MIVTTLISISLIALWVWAISSTLIIFNDNVIKNLKIILFEPGWFSFKSLFELIPDIMFTAFFLALEILAAIGLCHLIPFLFKAGH